MRYMALSSESRKPHECVWDSPLLNGVGGGKEVLSARYSVLSWGMMEGGWYIMRGEVMRGEVTRAEAGVRVVLLMVLGDAAIESTSL